MVIQDPVQINHDRPKPINLTKNDFWKIRHTPKTKLLLRKQVTSSFGVSPDARGINSTKAEPSSSPRVDQDQDKEEQKKPDLKLDNFKTEESEESSTFSPGQKIQAALQSAMKAKVSKQQ